MPFSETPKCYICGFQIEESHWTAVNIFFLSSHVSQYIVNKLTAAVGGFAPLQEKKIGVCKSKITVMLYENVK